MSSASNPLAHYIVEAQHIILTAQGALADPGAAIERLAKLMCSVEANHAFLEAGVFTSQLPGNAGGAQ